MILCSPHAVPIRNPWIDFAQFLHIFKHLSHSLIQTQLDKEPLSLQSRICAMLFGTSFLKFCSHSQNMFTTVTNKLSLGGSTRSRIVACVMTRRALFDPGAPSVVLRLATKSCCPPSRRFRMQLLHSDDIFQSWAS